MSSLSTVSIFAGVLAINLLFFGAFLAGGLAIVLRFAENGVPRLRYFISIIVFLTAVSVPLATTVFKHSVEQKVLLIAETDSVQKTEDGNSRQPDRHAVDKIVNLDSPAASAEPSENFINSLVLTLTNSYVGSLFPVIWIFGIVILFLRQVIGVWRLKQSRKLWVRANDFERESLNCPKNISLYFAADQTPGTIGWLRPAIVLPKEFPAEISLESKRFIVRHELAHACWRDPLARFILRTVRNLFWISPALWLIEHLTDTEREAAADRAAIIASTKKQNSRVAALNYAKTLLSIANAFSATRRKKSQPQLVGIGTESDLEIRICRILSSRRMTGRQLASVICACFLTVIMMAVIPIASFSEITEQAKNKTAFFNADQNNLSVVKNNDDSSLRSGLDVSTETATVRDADNFSQPKIPLKRSTVENSQSVEETSAFQRRERQNTSSSNSAEANNDEPASVKILNDEDSVKNELKENQQSAVRLSSLENLSPLNENSENANQLQSPEPARESSGALKSNNESVRQNILSETDRRRDYSPNPAAVPKLKPYKTEYIPYPAARGKP